MALRCAAEATAKRALYRSFWRDLAHVSRGNGARAANLRRLYRPQLREALLDDDTAVVQAHVRRTLALLRSSPLLVKNLGSLAYHHTPYAIPNTNNSSRIYSHLPKPIVWNPQDPGAARRAWDKRKRDDERDEARRIAKDVDEGLKRMWKAAELGQGVWLGRITPRSHADRSRLDHDGVA